MDMDPSGPFYKARQATFLSSSVALFTPLVCHPWEEAPMGWQFKAHGLTVLMPVGWRFKWLWVNGSNACGLTVQSSWVDGSNTCGLTVSMQMSSTVQTSDRLSGSHYGTWHVSFFNWFLSRIEASLRLPCTSPINIRVYLSHFFIFSWNILSKRNRHPCQKPPRSFC